MVTTQAYILPEKQLSYEYLISGGIVNFTATDYEHRLTEKRWAECRVRISNNSPLFIFKIQFCRLTTLIFINGRHIHTVKHARKYDPITNLPQFVRSICESQVRKLIEPWPNETPSKIRMEDAVK